MELQQLPRSFEIQMREFRRSQYLLHCGVLERPALGRDQQVLPFWNNAGQKTGHSSMLLWRHERICDSRRGGLAQVCVDCEVYVADPCSEDKVPDAEGQVWVAGSSL